MTLTVSINTSMTKSITMSTNLTTTFPTLNIPVFLCQIMTEFLNPEYEVNNNTQSFSRSPIPFVTLGRVDWDSLPMCVFDGIFILYV